MSDMLNLIRGNLNAAQYRAASFRKDAVLQIVAGPGTGKTKTLVSRVAHLLEQGVPPRGIVVTTFTNKAADELKERLGNLLKDSTADFSLVKAGTFHSICYKLLQKHGDKVGLRPKFGVADDAQQVAHLKKVQKQLKLIEKRKKDKKTDEVDEELSEVSSKSGSGSDSEFSSLFSPFKMKSYISELKVNMASQDSDDALRLYQQQLDMSNHIDFDDILTKTAELIRKHPEVVSEVETVLVDEFQDTNKIQMELVDLFSRHQPQRSITVIGDPDQSIYKFRFATEKNFQELRDMYANTEVVFLTENYRSTDPILSVAEEVISQDTARYGGCGQSRKLVGHSEFTARPELVKYPNKFKEAVGVAATVRNLRRMTKNRLTLSSVAILCRTNRQAVMFEEALVAANIPCFLAEGGANFWDKSHIRVVLNYLRCAYSDDDRSAFMEAMNIPRRRLSGKTAMLITQYLDDNYGGPHSVYHLLHDAAHRKDLLNITQNSFEGLRQFMDHIDHIRDIINSKEHYMDEVIEYLLAKVGLDEYVSSTGAREKAYERLSDIGQISDRFAVITEAGDTNLWDNEGAGDVSEQLSPLGQFLNAQALRSDNSSSVENGVTISTIHRAKGLEWPVVFVPNLLDGDIPMRMADSDIDEERRLFFVALTRAKRLLYMSYSREGEPSAFITDGVTALTSTPTWTTESVNELLRSLDLEEVDEMGTNIKMMPVPAGGFPGFTTASQLLKENAKQSITQSAGFKRASELGSDAPAQKKMSPVAAASIKPASKAKTKGKAQSSIFSFTKKSTVPPAPEDRQGHSQLLKTLPKGTEIKYREKVER
ncbi:ATP-dependent DNA helicase srs2 [Yarrowia sp. C11]|nr:ATP-dependent DNA helicase srs2 [Yarrowia sp. C11]KAG5370699.1 ATP-dependent DNA helicase srs2 [Yarrowia sp. E02]